MIGINDLGRGRNLSEIIADYNKILVTITKKLPYTKVFVQSVLPINQFIYVGNRFLKNNEQVVSLNKEIKLLSEKYNLNYIDLYAPMLSRDGQLNIDLTNDGIHLNGKGYSVWKNEVIQYVK